MSSDRVQLPPSHPPAPKWPLLVAFAVGLVVVVGVVLSTANPFEDDDSGGTLYTEAIVGQPSKINPLFSYMNEADRDIASLVFTGLTRLGRDGTPEPDLASGWDVSDDGLIVTFHLRSGVTWHSGANFTAEDVLFTYSLLANPAIQADPEQAALWQSIT